MDRDTLIEMLAMNVEHMALSYGRDWWECKTLVDKLKDMARWDIQWARLVSPRLPFICRFTLSPSLLPFLLPFPAPHLSFARYLPHRPFPTSHLPFVPSVLARHLGARAASSPRTGVARLKARLCARAQQQGA